MKYYIETLGCKVNTYESNVISELLENNGYIKDKNSPGVIVINTCTVTNTADNKSLKTLRKYRREFKNSIIVVCGCLPQVNKDLEDLKLANIVIGNKNKSKIVEYINEYIQTNKNIVLIEDVMDTEFESMQLNNTDRTRAFVKIEDGCSNFCSYCIIPYSRGNVRSKDPRLVKTEVKTLINNGHSEIVLTGIHTGHYGEDLDNFSFYDLLSELITIKGLKRLRISSIELNEITDEILTLFKNSDILVDHLHIPLQSGNDKILKLMNRKYDISYFKQRVEKIRSIRPNISLTTDVIVGFPGETDEDFLNTISNIKEISFSKIHVFPYSERKNTKSTLMDNKVDSNTIKARVQKLLTLSKELELNYMNKFMLRKVTFIPEVYKDGYLIGHTGNYLLIKCLGDKKLLNEEVEVTIKSVDYPYLIGLTNK